MDLVTEDHPSFKVWELLGWPSSIVQRIGLSEDLKQKKKHLISCREYRNSGAKLRAKGQFLKPCIVISNIRFDSTPLSIIKPMGIVMSTKLVLAIVVDDSDLMF